MTWDREKAKATNRKSYHKYADKRRTYSKKYYAEHSEEKSEYGKSYYQRNREKIIARTKETWLKRRYGISLDEYENLWQKQTGKCAVCACELIRGDGKGKNGGNVHLDHDHETKEIRGLLCTRCNLGLGFFLDSPWILKSAEKYLHRFI